MSPLGYSPSDYSAQNFYQSSASTIHQHFAIMNGGSILRNEKDFEREESSSL